MGPPGLVELEAKLDANPEPLAQFCLTGRLDNLTLGQPVVEVRSHGNAPLTSGPGGTTGHWWSRGPWCGRRPGPGEQVSARSGKPSKPTARWCRPEPSSRRPA